MPRAAGTTASAGGGAVGSSAVKRPFKRQRLTAGVSKAQPKSTAAPGSKAAFRPPGGSGAAATATTAAPVAPAGPPLHYRVTYRNPTALSVKLRATCDGFLVVCQGTAKPYMLFNAETGKMVSSPRTTCDPAEPKSGDCFTVGPFHIEVSGHKRECTTPAP